MTYPDGNSDRQPPGPYPDEYPAVRPEDVKPYNCDHDAGLCRCVHDWRIEWGNLPKKVASRPIYVTDSP